MPLERYYYTEPNPFTHIAKGRWPQPMPQMDWVDTIIVMETWLETYIGPHWQRWAWANEQSHETWQACVAFKYEKHKTLFLLTWA